MAVENQLRVLCARQLGESNCVLASLREDHRKLTPFPSLNNLICGVEKYLVEERGVLSPLSFADTFHISPKSLSVREGVWG